MSDFLDIELCCSKISLAASVIFIVCLYIPPASNLNIVQRYIDAVCFIESLMGSSDKIFIFGDFNQPGITWIPADHDCASLIPANASNLAEIELIDSLHSLGLIQLNPVCNHQNRILDLIFSNMSDDCYVTKSISALVPEDAFHPSLNLFCNIDDCNINNGINHFRYDFKRANFSLICEKLSSHDWSDFLLNNDIEYLSQEFYRVSCAVILNCVPLIHVRGGGVDYCHWFGPDLFRLKALKNRAYRKWRRTLVRDDYTAYRNLKSEFKCTLTMSYYLYVQDIQNNIRLNPQKFWKFIDSKKKSDGFPNVMHFSGLSSDNPRTISNLFAKFFQSVYTSNNILDDYHFFDYFSESQTSLFNSISFDCDEVLRFLNGLDSSFNPGPDGLPSGFLRNCAVPLHDKLCHMFNVSLNTGCFPAVWKDSFIFPIFKSGRRNKVDNYRGICKPSALPKILDAMVTDKINFYCKNIICHNQHGFIAKRSTITNLMTFTDFLTYNMKNGGQVDAIYTDFSKAFDRVNHSILLLKLHRLGFPNTVLNWIASFLSNRTQRVLFRNQLSLRIDVSSGVPQGSHIGPLLFILFINDLVNFLPNVNILMFADDLKIYMPVPDCSSSSHLQLVIDSLCLWCDNNLLELNVNKCFVISFTRGLLPIVSNYHMYGKSLVRVSSIKDLGVILDSKLNFNNHIDFVVNKATRMWGMVRRFSCDFSDPYVLKVLFVSFVRSILEYASIVWCPYYSHGISRIEAIQKRFLRFALRGLPWTNVFNLPAYEDRLLLLNLNSLSDRRKVAKVLFIYRLLIGEIDACLLLARLNILVPSANLRNNRFFVIYGSRANYVRLTSLNSALHEFNSFYSDIDFTSSSRVLNRQFLAQLNIRSNHG